MTDRTPAPSPVCSRCGDTGYIYDEEGKEAVNVRYCPCGSRRAPENTPQEERT